MDREEFERRRTALLARPIFTKAPYVVGYDIERGWLPIIERLVDRVEALPNANDLACVQVKEKFASLRFYLAGSTTIDLISPSGRARAKKVPEAEATADDLISEAEAESARTCQFCGAPGRRHLHQGWYSTLCDNHIRLIPLARTIEYDEGWYQDPPVVPERPTLEQAMERLRAIYPALRDLGVVRIGLGIDPGDEGMPPELAPFIFGVRVSGEAKTSWKVVGLVKNAIGWGVVSAKSAEDYQIREDL